MEEIKTGEKTGIKVEEYKGNYSLQAMRNGYTEWAKYKKNKNEYQDKDFPVKVQLGDRSTAEIALLSALFDVTGKTYAEKDQDDPF